MSHFAVIVEALSLADARHLAAAGEQLAAVLDQAAGDDRASSAVRTLVMRYAAVHPAATSSVSAELGRLACLADLLAVGILSQAHLAQLDIPATTDTSGNLTTQKHKQPGRRKAGLLC